MAEIPLKEEMLRASSGSGGGLVVVVVAGQGNFSVAVKELITRLLCHFANACQ